MLFQRPKRKFCLNDEIWFDRALLGVNSLGSLFQALTVSGVDRKAGVGRAGCGEKNRRAREGEPVSIVLTTSFHPLKKITLQGIKCQNFSVFGVELLARVLPLHSVLDVVLTNLANFTQFHRHQKEPKNICLPVQCL